MFIVIYKLTRSVLHSFDWWGEPVAPLNMRGQTVFTTSFGGVMGLVITVLMMWFTQTKVKRMINNDDPYLGQIDQPFDLMDPNTPEYGLAEN